MSLIGEQVQRYHTIKNPVDKDNFDPACYRSRLCHDKKVCKDWKDMVCGGVRPFLHSLFIA